MRRWGETAAAAMMVVVGVAAGHDAAAAGVTSREMPFREPAIDTPLTRFMASVERGELPAVFSRVPGAQYDPSGWGMLRVAAPMERPATLQPDARWMGGWLEASLNDRSASHYVYPASTVKLFAAMAAVEKLNALEREHGLGIGLDSPLELGPVREGEGWRGRVGDGQAAITVREEIHKLFVVSDNQAFNRLYDFVGPEELNERIASWGLERTWVTHRLAGSFSAEENARAPEVVVRGERGEVRLPERRWAEMPSGAVRENRCRTGLLCGTAVMRGGEAVAGPIDFTERNRTTLEDLQRALYAMVEWAGDARLDVTKEQREFLLSAAGMLPRESIAPVYAETEYPDDHVKFLLPGLVRVRPLEEWRVVNKIGLAYGYVTENAVVEHVPTGRRMYVAAAIHRNPDGVFNDDAYDYDTTLKEMADLGEVVGRALVGEAGQADPTGP
jgi:hypothetical protein